MDKAITVLDMLSGVSIYQQVKKDKLVKKYRHLLKELCAGKPDFTRLASDYSGICTKLYQSEYQGNLPDYLFDLILYDKNVFTTLCAHEKFMHMPETIKQAAKYDLHAFYVLAGITSADLKEAITALFPEKADIIAQFPNYASTPEAFAQFRHWGDNLHEMADFHFRNGVSMFAKYYAFYFADGSTVTPVKRFEPVSLTSLKKYELQKRQIMDNTLSFIHKKPANNVLLYGDRGTGKSTTVNAILNEYHNQGLRMIQIAKEDILYINNLLKAIENVPLRFIIFIDDLTFNENDECFNTLKAVLEGSLNAMPENVLIYATTNRRHLIKETFSSREGNELHASDTRDENASLADRFGLTITFTKPNLPDFLEIVCEIAKERGLDVDEETLRRGANTFAMKKASRSGRVARQYVDYVEGRISLNLPL